MEQLLSFSFMNKNSKDDTQGCRKEGFGSFAFERALRKWSAVKVMTVYFMLVDFRTAVWPGRVFGLDLDDAQNVIVDSEIWNRKQYHPHLW